MPEVSDATGAEDEARCEVLLRGADAAPYDGHGVVAVAVEARRMEEGETNASQEANVLPGPPERVAVTSAGGGAGSV